jgi:hypothetical protein
MVRNNQKGIVGLILLVVFVLVFVFFVGKRVWDANRSEDSTENITVGYVENKI